MLLKCDVGFELWKINEGETLDYWNGIFFKILNSIVHVLQLVEEFGTPLCWKRKLFST